MVSCLALIHRTHAFHGRTGEFSHTACGLGISLRHTEGNLFAVDPESASCEACQQALEAQRAVRSPDVPAPEEY